MPSGWSSRRPSFPRTRSCSTWAASSRSTRRASSFTTPGAHLPPGRDLFGEALKEAHTRGIRVIGRFDLSKTQKAVFDARPEWFFKRSGGEPAIYNGLYSACINGGYYREHALKILTEALERYEVDGLFFNMCGNQSADYSSNPMGRRV
jgi:uncharacterized lipoprotein YddW (UPF0748 family)